MCSSCFRYILFIIIYDIVRPKLRKVEKRLVPVLEMLSVDELMETNTYQRFSKLIDAVFETIDDDVIITDEMGKV